jgi:TPR repeat protein
MPLFQVISWNSLPEEQQREMDHVIESLNTLSQTLGDVSTEAQFVLGVIYENARGMSKPKPLRAAELYKSAAEAGCSQALYNLAGMTRVGGDGIVADEALAFCMYEASHHTPKLLL